MIGPCHASNLKNNKMKRYTLLGLAAASLFALAPTESKADDFRVYVDPGYQHARSQIRINLIWSISAFSNSSLRAESGLGLSSNAWERE